jgi:hypothetical protein
MQILFNKSVPQCRLLGARGGRAYARNLRLRKLQAPPPGSQPRVQLPRPQPETTHQASWLLDRQFPWLAEAFPPRRPSSYISKSGSI